MGVEVGRGEAASPDNGEYHVWRKRATTHGCRRANAGLLIEEDRGETQVNNTDTRYVDVFGYVASSS